MEQSVEKKTKHRTVSYAKWGYIFIASFFIVYLLFTLIPQIVTIVDSFKNFIPQDGNILDFEPHFCGFDNYVAIFQVNDRGEIAVFKNLGNTLIMWVMGAIPQLLVSLLLALIFTASKLKLKLSGFFKTLFYMPNLIMASAFAALFLVLFSTIGPFHKMFEDAGLIASNFDFISNATWARILVATMNFLMWFGNTTILLMAGIQSIDDSIFESAKIDGASSPRILFDITLPLLKPTVVYVIITSMIGGLQMFDVPQVLTGKAQNNDTKTMVMLINQYIGSSNYGYAGAVSVILFIITGILSIFVFKSINKKED